MPFVLLQNLTSTFFFSPLFPFSLSHSLPFPSLGDSHSDKALRLQLGECNGELTVEVGGTWTSQHCVWGLTRAVGMGQDLSSSQGELGKNLRQIELLFGKGMQD